MAKKPVFYFTLSSEQIEKLAIKFGKQLSRQDIQDLAKNYIIDLIEGKKQADPDLEYKKLRNLDLKVKISKNLIQLGHSSDDAIKILKEEKKLELPKNYKSFGGWKDDARPTGELKTNFETDYRELTSDETDEIVKFISFKNTFDGWEITCFKCQNPTTYKDRLVALHDAARHLSAVHSKEILKK